MSRVIYIKTSDGVILRFDDPSSLKEWLASGKVSLRDQFLDSQQRWRPVGDLLNLEGAVFFAPTQGQHTPTPQQPPSRPITKDVFPSRAHQKVISRSFTRTDEMLFGKKNHPQTQAYVLDEGIPTRPPSEQEVFSPKVPEEHRKSEIVESNQFRINEPRPTPIPSEKQETIKESIEPDIWGSDPDATMVDRRGGKWVVKLVIILAVLGLCALAVIGIKEKWFIGMGAKEKKAEFSEDVLVYNENNQRQDDIVAHYIGSDKDAKNGTIYVTKPHMSHIETDAMSIGEKDEWVKEVSLLSGTEDGLKGVPYHPKGDSEMASPKKDASGVIPTTKETLLGMKQKEGAQPYQQETSITVSDRTAILVGKGSYDGHMETGTRLLSTDPDKACSHFQAARQARPDKFEPLAKLGDCEFRRGNFTQAAVYYQSAIKMHPSYGPALIGLARTHVKLGNKTDAIHYYRQYLDVNKTGSQADEARRYLESIGEK